MRSGLERSYGPVRASVVEYVIQGVRRALSGTGFDQLVCNQYHYPVLSVVCKSFHSLTYSTNRP